MTLSDIQCLAISDWKKGPNDFANYKLLRSWIQKKNLVGLSDLSLSSTLVKKFLLAKYFVLKLNKTVGFYWDV